MTDLVLKTDALSTRVSLEFNAVRGEIADLTTDDIANASPNIAGVSTTDALNTIKELLYHESFSRTDPLLHQTANVFADYLSATFTIPADGDYILDYSFLWSLNNIASDFRVRIVFDGNVLGEEIRIEPKDSGGGSASIPNTTGGNTNNGTDQRIPNTNNRLIENLAQGTYDCILQFTSSGANLEPTIYEAVLSMKRTNIT